MAEPVVEPSGTQSSPLSPKDTPEGSNFSRSLLKLALPLALQSLLSAAVNYADVWILSAVHQTALAAVSLANQITFVLTLFYLGISGGLTILSAQYWGRSKTDVIEKILGSCVRMSLLISSVFCLLMLIFPRALMRLFTPDETLVIYGANYLRVLAAGCLLTAFSQMFLACLKSIERTKAAAFISSACLTANIVLDAFFIFVVFKGSVSRCIIGVAAATVLARGLECALSAIWLNKKSPLRLKIRYILQTEKWLSRDLTACTWRVSLNYLVWGGALTAISAIIGHISSAMVSAYAVATSVRNLATVACTGLASGGSILLGKHLGAGKLALARTDGLKLRRLALLLGVGAGLILLLIRPICLAAVRLDKDAMTLLDQMLVICSVWCVGKSFNSTLVGGVFCAGGDTGFGLICDTVAMWGVVLPLGVLSAFVWHLSPIVVFLILSMDEFIKMPFVALRYRQYAWVKDLTHQEEEK